MIRSVRCLVLLGALASASHAATLYAPTATFTATGSAGNWTLTFTIFQNITPANFSAQFVGLYMPGATQTGSPAFWQTSSPYNPTAAGGGGTPVIGNSEQGVDGLHLTWEAHSSYWNPAQNPSGNYNPGPLAGFQLHVTTLELPTAVQGWIIALNRDGCANPNVPDDNCAFPGTTPPTYDGRGVTWDWHANNPNSFGNPQRDEPAWNFTATLANVPEPSTYALLGLGFAAMGVAHRFRRSK